MVYSLLRNVIFGIMVNLIVVSLQLYYIDLILQSVISMFIVKPKTGLIIVINLIL
jgi:hypothetical protein